MYMDVPTIAMLYSSSIFGKLNLFNSGIPFNSGFSYFIELYRNCNRNDILSTVTWTMQTFSGYSRQ